MVTPVEEEGEPTDSLDELIAQARAALDAEGVTAEIVTYLAVDRSALNGQVETAVRRAVAFGAAAGCEVTTGGLFSTTVEATFSMTPTNWSGVVADQNSRLSDVIGGVWYAPVVDWQADHQEANADERPAFVLVHTAGNPADVDEAEQALAFSEAAWDFHTVGSASALVAQLDEAFDHVSSLVVTAGGSDELAFAHMALALKLALETGS